MSKIQFIEIMKALTTPNWTEVVSALVLAASLIVAAISVFFAWRSLGNEQKRSRRQLSIEMCITWSNFMSPETSSVTRLIERMDEEQCRAIANLGKLILNCGYKHHLLNILESRFPNIGEDIENTRNGDNYEIEGRYLQHIRYIAIRYLNMLESILLSWALAVANQSIIEDEFHYLFNDKEGRTAMETFRRVGGTGGYPAIAEFIKALREKAASGSKRIRRPPIWHDDND